MIIGADVGGTFTDIIAIADGVVATSKVPTTEVQSDGLVQAIARLGPTEPAKLIHGTTVATNALLERSGARTYLITDPGFEDVIEIGRQDRPSLYDSFSDRSIPLVERPHRIPWTGSLDVATLAAAEAVAVAMVDGYADPVREQRAGAEVDRLRPGVPVSLSSDVSPEFREFERISTTVLNAYLTPVTSAYLEGLESAVVGSGPVDSVAVMRSSGGLMTPRDAVDLPAAILLSGPAGGVVAARKVALELGIQSVVSFDMGGTSTDVCLIRDGEIDVSYERSVDGFVCRLPSVGVHTVGAGGGSIAWLDSGGSLRVGPASTGAIPGPACYGRGGDDPAVTDANVVLGRIDPDARLGGSLTIESGRAVRALEDLGIPLGLSATEAALGVVRIAESVMAGAVRTVSVDQGTDPADSYLVAFGGAGGLHATSVARSLGMRGVIVPQYSGVLSALGLLLAPPRIDAVEPVDALDGDIDLLRAAAKRLGHGTARRLAVAGHDAASTEFRLDIRYLGQAHEMAVPWSVDDGLATLDRRFGELHERRYGFARYEDSTEILALRCTATGTPIATEIPVAAPQTHRQLPTSRQVVLHDGTVATVDVIDRAGVAVGDQLVGPAIIEESDATTFIGPYEAAVVRANGALEVTW